MSLNSNKDKKEVEKEAEISVEMSTSSGIDFCLSLESEELSKLLKDKAATSEIDKAFSLLKNAVIKSSK